MSKFLTLGDSGKSIMLKPIKPFKASYFSQASGCLSYKGRKKSLEEMEKGIIKGAKLSNMSETVSKTGKYNGKR